VKSYYVYILASAKNGTLYIGVTNDLARRIYEHKNHLVDGFTNKYGVTNLVYYEEACDVVSAIEREKKLKNRHRAYKIALINKVNPAWKDLSEDF
jgi:putative endonuclease